MKPLTIDQIETAKKPDRPGRKKTNSSENYQNIYRRTKDSLVVIRQVAEILPDIEKHDRFEYAKNIVDLFTKQEFEPILKGIFPTKQEEGAPLTDIIYFDTTRMNMERVIFASDIMTFSSRYLLQAFPKHQYEFLYPRIEGLVRDLASMRETFNRSLKLQKQLEEYKKHTEHFHPVSLIPDHNNYTAICRYCKVRDSAATEKEVVKKIKHLEKCNFLKVNDRESPAIWRNWIEVKPPSKLVINWEQYQKLEELHKSS